MDKLTASKILGVAPGCSIEEIKEAFRKKTEEIQIEEDPQGFALVQTAYRALTKTGDSVRLSTSTRQAPTFSVTRGLPDLEDGLEYEDGEKELFTKIVEGEAQKDREEYDRQEARENLRYILEQPKANYDYVKLLKYAQACELNPDECEGLAKQLTTVHNLTKWGKNRIRRTEGFDEFVTYLYSRTGRTFNPRFHKARNIALVLLACYFASPAVLGIIWGLVESFRSIAGEFNSMEGAADKASFVVMFGMQIPFVIGLILILRKTAEMRRKKRSVIIVAYIVAFEILSIAAILITYNVLR